MPGTTRVEIRTLKVGRYCCVDDKAYKINSISKSKPGKHGSAKARMELVDIFTGQKISHVGSVTDSINVPLIEKGTAMVTHIDGAEVQGRALGFDPAAVWVEHPIQDRTDDEMIIIADKAIDELIEAITQP